MLCYLAETIDRRDRPITHRLTTQLANVGLAVYRPLTCWSGGPNNPRTVEQLNRTAIDNSNILVADLTGGPSVGVPAEIEYATRTRGIPALVIHNQTSVTLDANPMVVQVPATRPDDQIAEHAHELATAHSHLPRNPLWYTHTDGAAPLAPAYPDDAGIDLHSQGDHLIGPGQFVDIPTTVTGVQTPHDTWLLVTGRSSTFRKKGLHVPVSVIDPGWRGPLLVGVWNYTTDPVKVTDGDRVGQIVAIHNRTAELTPTPVGQLDPHQRGTAGFGSTG